MTAPHTQCQPDNRELREIVATELIAHGEFSSTGNSYPNALLAADAVLALVGCAWREIKTAPQDGSEVWAFNGEQARMKWISGAGYALWTYADELLADADPDCEQPTHWMPLPRSPAVPLEQEKSHD